MAATARRVALRLGLGVALSIPLAVAFALPHEDPTPTPAAERLSTVSGTIVDFDDAENSIAVEVEGAAKAEVVNVVKTPETRLVKSGPEGQDMPATHSDFEQGARIRATGAASGVHRLVAEEIRLLARPRPAEQGGTRP